MTAPIPARAMVLAAGRGLRMRPLTDRVPKPLIAVGGLTMLERVLDHLAAAGVGTAVVNTHWLADQVEERLVARRVPRIVVSREAELLETGGGVVNALPDLGAGAFFVANADVVWTDGPAPALGRLAAAWNDAVMDALLLVHPVAGAVGYDGAGDFHMDASGRLAARGAAGAAPLVFTGVQILHPRLFAEAPGEAFSLNVLYRRAATAGRLFGLVHDGAWYHVGTPPALAAARAAFDRQGKASPG